MKIKEVLLEARSTLTSRGLPEASLEAEILVRHALSLERARFYASLEEEYGQGRGALSSMIDRRLRGEPLAYILGQREFFGAPLQVNRHVLVPRQETELLVEKALEQAHRDLESLDKERRSALAGMERTLQAEVALRLQAEDELRDNEDRLRAVAESVADVVYEWDIESAQMRFFDDPRAKWHEGLKPPETLADLYEAMHPDDRERVRAALEQGSKHGSP